MSVRLALDRFRNVVVKESKTALTKQGKNVSKELYNSIDSELKVSKNSFELSFLMEDYGTFIDKGVKGNKSSAKAPSSPFKYTNKMPPTKAFDKWVIKRGLAGRNKKGQFVSRESLKFAIAKSVQMYGIETTNFFTKPFESAFKNLPDEVVEAYGLEVENLLKTSLK
jgi:hypothetical protein